MKFVNLDFQRWLIITLITFSSISVSQAQTPVFTSENILETSNISTVSIESLLEKFVRNGSKQLFDGTFIYLFEDKIQTVKVHRKVDVNGQVVEEFIPLDGNQKTSSRVLEEHHCLLDNNWQYQFDSISSSFPFRVNNTYQKLQLYYNFTLLGVETIAGMSAVRLLIESKDPYRYSYHLWFEPKEATLLKYKLVDSNAKLIEQYLFTNISFQGDKEQIKNLDEVSTSTPCIEQFAGMTEAFQKYFNHNKIPAGFELVSFRKGYIDSTERQAFQFQLSDGLSAVSVFIEDSKKATKSINGVVKLGPVNIAGKNVSNHQITIIGAIPIVSALEFIKAEKLSENEYFSSQ
ncbi:MAG: MucB/RseB C-terminal domain-containing protein [Gammaproteobacteria bacterium]|nr:MucB/RseB C-terminal domain-containing protein [Gammaproteobacteria bacterium]